MLSLITSDLTLFTLESVNLGRQRILEKTRSMYQNSQFSTIFLRILGIFPPGIKAGLRWGCQLSQVRVAEDRTTAGNGARFNF
jgi:hypothetical protein